MLRENFIQKKLKSGVPVIGTWASIPSPVTADILSSSGLDFIVIDSEHGPLGFETAQSMVCAAESRGVSPMMRVSGVNESEILKALDIGAHGIHVPNLTSVNELDAIIRFAKYPPEGQRGFSPFTRAGNYSGAQATTHTQRANQNTLLCIHIEGQAVIAQIDDFLSRPALDIVFIGLFDLSKSIGLPGQVDHPDVLRHLDTLVTAIRKANKTAGTIAMNSDNARRFIDMGIHYITYAVDVQMLSTSYASALDRIRKKA